MAAIEPKGFQEAWCYPSLVTQMMQFCRNQVAAGAQFLECNGQFVSTATYNSLFQTLSAGLAAVGGPVVDGTDFQIPDLRGKTLVQAGSLLGTDRFVGDTVGSEDVDLSGIDFTATVKHSSSDEAGGTFVLKSTTVPNAAEDTDVIQITNTASDTNPSTKNIQPSFVTRYIIKT